MTTEVAPAALLLGTDEGEGVWFADSLLSYKVTGDETHGQLALAEVRAPRGSGSPVHTHRHEDEAWYIIEGELTFWLGDESRTATTGDFVFGPRGVRHRFRVDSEVARFLILVTPAGFEDFTRACGWPATAGTLPPPDLPPPPRRGTRRRSPTVRHRHRFAVGTRSPVQPAPRDRPGAKPCPMHQVPLTTIRSTKA
jgi:quercetin dioxygenase-like cupin family protein